MANGQKQAVQLHKRYSMAISEAHLQQIVQKGIRPEHVRRFIEEYGQKGDTWIASWDWRRLKDIVVLLSGTTSLQLVGDVGSGKTHLIQELIRNDHDRVYIVLDAHHEYDFLPVITQIAPDLKESCRIELPKQPEGALGMFRVYYNLITNNKFPAHYVFVVEEALRYKNAGMKNLLAETRKFIFCIAVTQESLVTFCRSMNVKPYREIPL